METIFKRRSIRKYTSESVPKKIIEKLIKAGMSAPSAGNEQPWHFVVITERDKLDTIAGMRPHAEMLKQAPVAILICGDLTLEKHKGFWVQDCSAATENILLAATAKGLGSVWLGVYPREDRVEGIRKLFNIPQHIVPLSLLPIGYPAEEKPPKNEFDTSRIHCDTW